MEFLIFRIHQFHVRIFDTNIPAKRLITFHTNSPSTVPFTVLFTRDIFGYTNSLGNSWFFEATNYFRNSSLELQMLWNYQLLFEFFGKFRSPPTTAVMIGDLSPELGIFCATNSFGDYYFWVHQLFRAFFFLDPHSTTPLRIIFLGSISFGIIFLGYTNSWGIPFFFGLPTTWRIFFSTAPSGTSRYANSFEEFFLGGPADSGIFFVYQFLWELFFRSNFWDSWILWTTSCMSEFSISVF